MANTGTKSGFRPGLLLALSIACSACGLDSVLEPGQPGSDLPQGPESLEERRLAALEERCSDPLTSPLPCPQRLVHAEGEDGG